MHAAAATARLKHALAFDRLRHVFATFGHQRVGDLCRWDGARWEPLTGPAADREGSEAFTALAVLLGALSVLDGIETAQITSPGPAQVWQGAIEQAYQAYDQLEGLLQTWGADLERAARRGQAAHADAPKTVVDRAMPWCEPA